MVSALPDPSATYDFQAVTYSFTVFYIPGREAVMAVRLGTSKVTTATETATGEGTFPVFSPQGALVPGGVTRGAEVGVSGFYPG